MKTAERSTDLDEILAKVTTKIASKFGLPSHVAKESRIDAAFLHHFGVAGKQTRSTLAIEASRRLRLDAGVSLCLAACVECLHNASLVQDDVQDSALERRGQSSIHSLFGDSVALGLTTQLVSTAYVLLAELKEPAIYAQTLRRLHQAIGETALGQTRDLDPIEERSLESALSIARQKSGPLFALALELPLIAAGKSADLDRAHEAACSFGLGYQIIDDLKDRKVDELSPTDANVVNRLLENYASEEAVRRAEELAENELERSIALAHSLPSEAGALLASMAGDLSKSLGA